MPKPMLTRYSLSHAAVDFSCAFLVYRCLLTSQELWLYLLLYNFCAFALQMPLGLLADGWNRNAALAAAGCVLVSCAFLPILPGAAAVLLAGVGNAAFHVGGGLDVLNGSAGRCAALGVFVSPGAMGLYLGAALGRGGGIPVLLPVLLLLLCEAAILLGARKTWGGLISGNAPVQLSLHGAEIVCAAALTAVVALRSYMGFNQALPWKGEGSWGLWVTAALVLGKAAGGFLADRLGIRAASALSLGLSAVLYLFSANPLAGTAAVFCFNMTMPITLFAAARLTPGAKGFAFGLLTFALFLGFVPTWLGLPSLLVTPWANALGAAVSAVLLLWALGLEGRREALLC